MIHGLLLAAGKSTRFGSQKLLTALPNAQSMVHVCAETLLSSVDHVSVVVNPDDPLIIDSFLEYNVSIVPCPQSKFGMAHSIACGVAKTKSASGWVIALADMPLIKTDTIKSVVAALREGVLIAAPMWEGRRGHPVGFSQKLYSELTRIHGDTGARALLNRYQSDVVEIECHDPGIFFDIDTLEDFARYSKKIRVPMVDVPSA